MKTLIGASSVKRSTVAYLPLFLAVAAAVAIMLVWSARTAYAHGESIQAAPSEVKPGELMTVTGEEFEPGEEVELALEGVRGTIPLGHADVNEDGSFSESLTIPSSAAAGSYQLVAATAEDRITLDFTVLQGGEAASSPGTMEVVFQRSTTETIVIGLIAVALVASGTALVFPNRESGHVAGWSSLLGKRLVADGPMASNEPEQVCTGDGRSRVDRRKLRFEVTI